MVFGTDGSRTRRGGVLARAVAIFAMIPAMIPATIPATIFASIPAAILAAALFAQGASAQIFSDSPPPVPPVEVPNAGTAPNPAPNQQPPAGTPAPDATAPATAPQALPQAAIPPAPPPVAAPAGPASATLALSARYGKDLPAITGGLVWRVFADRPNEAGVMKLIREDKSASPTLALPPGNYVVHVSFGLVSDARFITLKADTSRETFVLAAGGLTIEGRVGSNRIPQNQISFAIYKGSQFDGSSSPDAQPLLSNVAAGEVVLLPEGTYYIISNYGDANSVVRSDIRVQVGKLTDVTVSHRAAVITLKLVSEKGGEALANTSWSVLNPGGDLIKESVGAFPRVVLSEGEYRVLAKNEGRVFERSFDVVNGVDGEVEVLAR